MADLGLVGPMYPVRLQFDKAVSRIDRLNRNGHHAEALVTSVFTLEKIVRRGLRFTISARGFSARQADLLLERTGFKDLRKLWPIFERTHRPLPDFIGNRDWQFVPEAVTRRNKLVHGIRVYPLAECKTYSGHVLAAIKRFRTNMLRDYGVDPWKRLTGRRKPALQWIA